VTWFFKKKDEGGDSKGGDGVKPGEPKYTVQAESAAKFFDAAKVRHDTGNYEYALSLWLDGLHKDPTSMRGMESFFQSSAAYLGESGGKPPSRDVMKKYSGSSELERFLAGLINWAVKPQDADLAVSAAEGASKLGLGEQTYWIGERAMGAIARDRKPRKDLFVELMKIFKAVGAYDKAVECGEAARKLDPADSELTTMVRNMAAQATMTKGGYEQSGQSGGFRSNVRDADKQRQLEESERIVKTEETVDRLIDAARKDWESRKDDPAAITVYITRLRERARPEDEKIAMALAKDAFEKLKQFRFRQIYGELRIKRAQRMLAKFKSDAEASPGNTEMQEKYRLATQEFPRLEIEELQLRVDNYPTDLGIKYELGKRYYDLGTPDDTEKAIALLQESKNDAKHRVSSLQFLAMAFQRIGWNDEAIPTFRQAIENHRGGSADELGMELQYGLMTALQTKADGDRSLSVAEEADKIASEIAIQKFSYKDIRQRKDALRKLIADLKKPSGA
jgi:tetratricopeptide (TPR) repeat protein